MAGGADLDDDEGITGINVTPLVDIMLVLLIIFMVASNYIVKEAIEVNLPKAATGEEVNNDNKSIALILKKDGRIFLNDETGAKLVGRYINKEFTLNKQESHSRASIPTLKTKM
mgnify:CR=1 FL=1